MIYADFDSLCAAIADIDVFDVESSDSLTLLEQLIRVYFDALHNPPEGIIGVGAITYAEQMLINFQLNDKD